MFNRWLRPVKNLNWMTEANHSLTVYRHAMLCCAVVVIALCTTSLANAQQSPSKKTRAKPARNVLHLPKVDVSEDRGTLSPRSLPSIKSPMRLSSTLVIESDDLLLPEDEQPTESPLDNSTDNKTVESEKPGDKFEAVTPVPIQPNDQFDANWIQRNGGERLPPKRQLYDLNKPKRGSDSATPSIPNTPPKIESQLDRPSEVPNPLPDRKADSVDSYTPPKIQTWGVDSQPSENDWSGFPRLRPTLADRLNYAQHNLSEGNTGLIQGTPYTAQEQTTFPRLLDGSGELAVPLAVNPGYAPAPSGFLNQSVNERLFCPQEPVQGYALGNADYHPEDFAPVMVHDLPQNLNQDLQTYYGKQFVPTQRPLVELGRPFYGDGIFSPAIPVFSDVDPLQPQFLIYGEYRAGVGVHRNNGQPVRSIANRLALEMDLRLTGTERFHALTAPLDHNGRFTRLDFSDSSDVKFEREMDAQFDTGFFEGDLGAIVGGVTGQDAPFDLPIAAGLMPMTFQNGIWMEDIVAGVAVSLPWRHSTALNWANYDATFFALFDQITSPAFLNQNSAANAFGSAWFIEAYDGYIEADYAYMLDTVDSSRSYHNSALAYTRRYFERWSNSVRVINNFGQDDPSVDRTADGTLLLLENSLVTAEATTVIPYANFFYGTRRTQSVARAGAAGGILRNTGILFESDNLTNYPTLDATANNAYGGALGLNLFASNFRRQLVMEFAGLDTYGDPVFSKALGPQYGLGGRYQHALTNWTLLRFDAMVGWRENDSNIYGTRAEWRWKF